MGRKYKKSSSSFRLEKYDHDTKSTDGASSKYDDEAYTESLLDGNDSKEDLDEQKLSKHIRHRKRNLFNQVRDQMEFYFSDANLLKDRFLTKIIREDPYVPLETFLSFNKIKKSVKTSADLIKALSSSTLLQLNEDKTCVARLKPFQFDSNNANCREETDVRTIYVESLPSNADHEWVKKVFTHASNGGTVTYVSLPRYKISKQLKEFGFVEFQSIKSVEKCIKTFDEFNGRLYYDKLDPINLISIKSFLKENESDIDQKLHFDNKLFNYNKNKKKINLNSSIGSINDSGDEPLSKRIKLHKHEHDIEINLSQNSGGSDDDTESDHELNDNVEIKKKKTKLRKKKKKDKKKKTIEKPSLAITAANATTTATATTSDSRPLNLEVDLKGLRILTKIEWKRLRNKYLNLQRKKINELKKKNWQKNNENAIKGNLLTNKKQVAAVKHIGRLNQQIAASTSLQKIQPPLSSQLTTGTSQIITAVTSSVAAAAAESSITTPTKSISSALKSSVPTTNTSSSSSSSSSLTVTNVKNFDMKKSPHMNFYRVNKEIDGGLYDEDDSQSTNNDTSSLDSPGINSPSYSMLEKRRKLLSPITNSTKTEIKKINNNNNSNLINKLNKLPSFKFEPGIIIKIKLKQSCLDIKSFKNHLKKQYEFIKYIDIKENLSNIAYLRCDTPKNAQLFCNKNKLNSTGKDCSDDTSNSTISYSNSNNNIYHQCQILDGTEESKYWDKIMKDRDMKLNKGIKIKSKRGREKIPKLISNHIRFVEEMVD